MPESYRHTQFGKTTIAAFVAGIAGIAVAMLFTKEIPLAGRIAQVVVLGVLISVLACFYLLAVAVSEEAVTLCFGIGLIRIRIPLKEVVRTSVVENPWYYGCGIKYIGKGWLYSVSGRQAVELEFKNGRRARIGTDDPEGLLKAIKQRLASE